MNKCSHCQLNTYEQYLISTQKIYFMKINLKMLPLKWWPFCSGLNMSNFKMEWSNLIPHIMMDVITYAC